MRSLVLALLLAVLSSPPPAAAQERSVEELQGEVWTLKCENGFAQAVETARELLDAQIAREAPAYDIAYARVQLELVRAISDLSPEAQAELTYAYSLNGAISTAHYEADYAEGLRLCREQYDTYTKHLGPGNLDAVYILGGMAFFAEMLGDYAGAMDMFQECLEGMRDLLGNGHPQVAMHLNNLAALHANLGNYNQAEELMQRALDYRIEALGPDHPHVAQSLNNLAVVNKRRGDNLKAEALYHRALAIYREARGPESESTARLLNNMGVLLYEQKDFAAAEEKLEEALAVRESVLGPEHADVAVSLMNVARLRTDQERFQEADELCRRAVEIRRDTFGDPHPKLADTYAEMAAMARDRGREGEAENLIREAQKIWESFWGPLHPKLAEGWVELARVQRQAGRTKAAVASYGRAVEILENHPVAILPREVDARIGLAELLQKQGRYGEAREHLERAAQQYELARVRAGSALHRDWVMASPYPRLAAARLMDFEETAAWEAYEAGLSRKLSDLVLDLELRPISEADKVKQAELLQAMERAQEKLDALAGYRSGTEDERAEYERVREELIRAEAGWIDAQQEDAPAVFRPTSLASVQSHMGPGDALVGWLDLAMAEGEFYSAAYVIRNRGPVSWVALPGTHQDAEAFRHKLEVASAWPFRLGPDLELDDLAGRLWQSRLAPLLPHLQGVAALVVIPSGAMRGIPVEVLRDESGLLLGDRFAVSYAPSATLYGWLKERSEPADPGGVLLVGDPVFAQDPPRDRAAREPASDALVFRSALAGNRRALDRLPPLPGSRREVELLSGILGESVVLIGDQATESRILGLAREGALGRFRTMHLATHALVDPDQPARSALVLSRRNLPDPVEQALSGEPIDDGLLTVREILADCRLNADLVTLSACRTAGSGPLEEKDTLGLAPAFLQAGARNLLVSLWPVDDQATLRLMTRFYENTANGRAGKRLGKAEALAEAKTWLRGYTETDGSRPFRHPVYWAGFVLVGAGD